jgi:predicted metalloprotease with PDZ domain
MRFALLATFLLAAAAGAAGAQEIRYEISFPNRVHREAEVTAIWTGLPTGTLQVRMSRSSPGRYALHEFAKNVYSVKAVDGSGGALRVVQPDPYGWDVSGHDGTVRFSYTLYGDRADGTYTGIDASHAHLNMPATFAWARGTESRPITVTFRAPEGSGWKVATQLSATEDPFVFTAPHLQYFLDSPTEVSDHVMRSWSVAHAGKSYTIRLALHHRGSQDEANGYAEMARKVVSEQIAMWGEPAEYDFGTYTFLACYLPWVSGDGMEHRNSTILTSTASLADNALGLLNTLSHEYFHSWNVERLRPADLEPFDFERANMSRVLWLAEGFTSYYDALFVHRAGLLKDDVYLQRLAGSLDAVIAGQGREFFSPVEMSMQAPFVDAAVSIDPNNRANTFISYYTWGSMVGLGLDLSIRARFPGKSLDDFMRALWTRFGRQQADYSPVRRYTIADLRATLADVTGDRAFADEFFDRYIEGRDVPDYAELLARAGLLLRKAEPGKASFGQVQWQPQEGQLVVGGATLRNSPAYAAGLDRGDVLLAIDGAHVVDPADVQRIVQSKRPGDTIAVEFRHRGEARTARTTLAEETRLELVSFESAGRPMTDEMRRFRADWLSSKVR